MDRTLVRRNLYTERCHLEEGGETCLRCSRTGEMLEEVVAGLGREFGPRGVEVTFEEVLLKKEDVAGSNAILFNGSRSKTCYSGSGSPTMPARTAPT